MIMDKMKTNDIKTEFLILGTKQQHNKVNINGDIVFDILLTLSLPRGSPSMRKIVWR